LNKHNPKAKESTEFDEGRLSDAVFLYMAKAVDTGTS
jgi:hypothetical protein